MKEITFATTNKGKFTSAKRVLEKYSIKTSQSDIELPESQDSLEYIAKHKAKYAFKALQKPVIAMDAGFFIHSLNGFPMMYVKPVLESIGIEGILKLVEGKKRECEFKEVLSFCASETEEPQLFVRIVKGVLSEEPLGIMNEQHWSKLALIFIPEHETKTMAEMESQEYLNFRNRVEQDSHFEQFAQYYSK